VLNTKIKHFKNDWKITPYLAALNIFWSKYGFCCKKMPALLSRRLGIYIYKLIYMSF